MKATTHLKTMETNSNNNSKKKSAPARKKSKRRQRVSLSFSAEEKAQAVMAIWTEKISQNEICRQLQINYVTLQTWQRRAMEGMLQALEDHARLADGAALSPRLRKLMERQSSSTPGSEKRLEDRLKAIQQGSDKIAAA